MYRKSLALVWRQTLVAAFLLPTEAIFGESSIAAPDTERALISQLLEMPAPPPDWRDYLRKRMAAGWTPPTLLSTGVTDDSPIAQLANRWRDRDNGEIPSPKALERLIDICKTHPDRVGGLVMLFDSSQASVVAQVKRTYDALPSATDTEKKNRRAVHDWLMLRGGFFRETLLQQAEAALAKPDDPAGNELLTALATQGWPVAESLLRRHASEDETPAIRETALEHLYQHEKEVSKPGAPKVSALREELQKIVESEAPAQVRVQALHAVAQSDWPGRTEWVLQLLKISDLGDVQKEQGVEQPLAQIVHDSPDFWIPKIVPLVSSANRTERDNAVRCLIQFNRQDSRVDALRPLLPWLTDPAWALQKNEGASLLRVPADDYGRLHLLQSLGEISLPESVPGLEWSLEHLEDGFDEAELRAIADALVHYHAKSAVPALKRAFSRTTDRWSLMKDLVLLDGYSIADEATAVEAYARKTATAAGRHELVKANAVAEDLLLGSVLTDLGSTDAKLAKRLFDRVEELRQDKTTILLADDIERLVIGWGTVSGAAVVRARLATGNITADWLVRVLDQRESLRSPLLSGPPLPWVAGAVRAALTGDAAAINEVLRSADPKAVAMLCACARLERVSLPADALAPYLHSSNHLVARAAELYLESEDSPQARALVLAQHPGEARILGVRSVLDPANQASELLISGGIKMAPAGGKSRGG